MADMDMDYERLVLAVAKLQGEVAELKKIARNAEKRDSFPIRSMPPVVKDIIDNIAAEHGLYAADVLSRARNREVAHARQEAMFEIRKHLGWSLPRIARVFGMDHTTVMHGIKAHEGRKS